jgi:NAD(P)H-flavin reductase
MLLYRISSIAKTTGDAKIFRMEPLGAKLLYKPGQFTMVHLLDGRGASLDKRPYSITSAPDYPYLEFCIKMAGGRFTSRLDELKGGETVGIEGPMGAVICEGDRCAFICGGTGIAPVMSIARDIARADRKGSFLVFCSAREKRLLLYHDELLELEKKNPSLKVVFTLTREEPKGWSGRCGRISEALLREFVPSPKDFDWFICGPLEMAKTLRECVVGMGADPKRVHVEGWG